MPYTKQLVLFSLIAMNIVDQPAPEVEIEQGILSGKISTDGTFFEYVGIPYAKTNSKSRFQAPLPPPSWEGVFKAIDEHYQCPQSTHFGVMGVEDCLKINVYVPAKRDGPLPVMVYIHGGAFIFGSGGKLIYAPDFIVKKDIILVTFNYRLGALGFLCLNIKEAPGNAGLKDQIAALRWIKKNIAAFGGDPDNVTIFGQSAGSTSVTLMLASKATEGLFNKVIAQSGSSLSDWAINLHPVLVGSRMAKERGYNTENPYEIYEIFSKIPHKDLIQMRSNTPITQLLISKQLHLPCVEKAFPGVEAAIDDLPYNLLTKAPKNVSVIYGSVNKEGLFFIAEETEKSLEDSNRRHLYASDIEFKSNEESESTAKRVREFYFDNKIINFETINNLSDIYGQLYFEMPAIIESEIMLSKVSAPIFNYHFTYSGGRNLLKAYYCGQSTERGACHGDDIFYLFKGSIWPFRIKEKDQQVIDWMSKMWTNFAKYGDPTPPSAEDLPVRWIASKKDDLKFLFIGDDLKMGSVPNPDAFKLWKDVYKKYRKTYVK